MHAVTCALALTGTALALAPSASAASGDPDPTFGGGDGIFSVSPRAAGQLRALTLDGDRILATGTVLNDEESCQGTQHALLRLTRSGALDGGFGTGGLALTFPVPCDPNFPSEIEPFAVAVDGAGRIVTAGLQRFGAARSGGGWVSRHAASGALDPSFDGDGWLKDGDIDQGAFTGVVPLADGRTVVAGHSSHMYTGWQARRYLHDGAPDPAFGGDGSLAYPAGPRPGGHTMAALIPESPDGTVVAVGNDSSGEALSVLVGRIGPDGTLDPGFGSGGIAEIGSPGERLSAHDGARTADGGYVTAGTATPVEDGGDPRVLLLKVDADGVLDETFGAGGRVDGPLGFALALAVDDAGRLVVAYAGEGAARVARYLTHGAIDETFGDGGTADLPRPVDGAGLRITDLLVQPDGAIVVGGWHRFSEKAADRAWMDVVRLQGDHPPATGTDSDDGEIGDPGEPGGGGVGNRPGGDGGVVIGGPVPNRQGGGGRVSIRIVSSRVTKLGVLVRVTWPRGTDGTARARLWTRNKGILLGQRTVAAPRGTRGRTFRVPLNARAKRLLKSGKRLKVRATVRVTGLPA